MSGPAPGAIDRLRTDELAIVGRMPWSSNATFLVEVGGEDLRAVYKPERGERPLWDFPSGLWRREVAAWELSRALGWEVIPPTIARDGDAPLGRGSLQWFVDADFEQHYFTLLEDPDARFHDQLRRMCVFDLVANSTDRKGGHVLVDGEGHVWGVDNGLSFSVEGRLRTVIWDFAGEAVPDDERNDLCRLLEDDLPAPLAELLDPLERDAVRARARAVVAEGRFPHDPTGRRFPWPLV